MITTIGFVAITTLVWVLVEALTRESDAESRRTRMGSKDGLRNHPTGNHESVKSAT